MQVTTLKRDLISFVFEATNATHSEDFRVEKVS